MKFLLFFPYTLLVSEFEKTNWSWQLSQLQQQVGEWLELQFSKFNAVLPSPNWSFPGWLAELLRVLAWLGLGLLAIWLIWQVWWRLEPYLYPLLAAENTTTQALNQTSTATWLERSQFSLRQGNYREACRCLYLAMLQRLHDTGMISHQSSRTDGEYWQLVQQLPQSQAYQTLITTHEQLCFSNAEILPETFEQCSQAYREIAAG